MKIRNLLPTFACIAALAAATHAAPIRVGIFKSVGQNRYWHTSIHTGSSAIVAILANPDSANLGPNLIIPQGGFVTTLYGLTDGTTGTATVNQKAEFIAALDDLDVAIFPHNTDIGQNIADTNQRKRLQEFIHAKGAVSIHGSIDTYGSWPAWDSLHGTRFQNWTNGDRYATLHLDTVSRGDPNLGFLNRGLPDTARILEEWMSFTTNGDVIRARSGLKVAVTVDETSYAGGMGGARAMGDHPISWFREFPGGGRFFFTALGHRNSSYLGSGTTAMTLEERTFFRRQLYNAILWAAGVDSNGVVSVRGRAAENASMFPDAARITVNSGAISISILHDGAHSIELRGVDGRRVGVRSASGRADHIFTDLRPGVHIVAITTPRGRHTRRVMIP